MPSIGSKKSRSYEMTMKGDNLAFEFLNFTFDRSDSRETSFTNSPPGLTFHSIRRTFIVYFLGNIIL